MDRTNAKRAAERAPARAAAADEEDGTRDRILKTAERLFAERGRALTGDGVVLKRLFDASCLVVWYITRTS